MQEPRRPPTSFPCVSMLCSIVFPTYAHHFAGFLSLTGQSLRLTFCYLLTYNSSGSMAYTDRRPLTGTPVSAQVQRIADNRLGAVYTALYGFWTSRSAATTTTTAQAGRRDAYSVVLFDTSASTVLSNDFTSDVNGLLNTLLRYNAGGGTSFVRALDEAKRVMLANWSSERYVLTSSPSTVLFKIDTERQLWFSYRMAKTQLPMPASKTSRALPLLEGTGSLLSPLHRRDSLFQEATISPHCLLWMPRGCPASYGRSCAGYPEGCPR